MQEADAQPQPERTQIGLRLTIRDNRVIETLSDISHDAPRKLSDSGDMEVLDTDALPKEIHLFSELAVNANKNVKELKEESRPLQQLQHQINQYNTTAFRAHTPFDVRVKRGLQEGEWHRSMSVILPVEFGHEAASRILQSPFFEGKFQDDTRPRFSVPIRNPVEDAGMIVAERLTNVIDSSQKVSLKGLALYTRRVRRAQDTTNVISAADRFVRSSSGGGGLPAA